MASRDQDSKRAVGKEEPARDSRREIVVTVRKSSNLARAGMPSLPPIILAAGEKTARRFVEFFAATIRNKNTRVAYVHAVGSFLIWCEERSLSLQTIDSLAVAAYIEQLTGERSAPTVKQHLATIRMCFDWLVTGGELSVNPSWSVRGPKHVVKKGKTPVLSAEQARELLDSIALVKVDEATGIQTPDLVGLRDRALIAAMVFSFARVGAVVKMDVTDYWQNGKRWWFRLHEKGGKHHEVPCHHVAESYLDEYLKAAGISHEDKDVPLFRTTYRRTGQLTSNRMTENDVLRMVKRRARAVGLPGGTCCHTFRATGITAYLKNNGTVENAQAIAAHESPRTTKLYDRRSEEISLAEIEKVQI